ncbi:MAG: ankyrin repeat domain-containing protein [Pseudomonadota bacterium]|nr:ankyrin repeat domain-containing protein [Pseudomonadota bacterium]
MPENITNKQTLGLLLAIPVWLITAIAGWLALPLALAGFWLTLAGNAQSMTRPAALALGKTLATSFGLALLLLLWPALRLGQSGSLWAALALSAGFGFLLLALWRRWPLWRRFVAGEIEPLDNWQSTAQQEPLAWQGLKTATPAALLAALPVLLAVPGLMTGATRWLCAVLLAALPLTLWLRQARRPRSSQLQGQKTLKNAEPVALESLWDEYQAVADAPAEKLAQPLSVGEAEKPKPVPTAAELYAAARGGRVESALALLAAGADPGALPPAEDRDQRTLLQLAAVLPDLRLLRELIARGVSVAGTAGKPSPLLAATRDSWHGRPEAVMTLLANGANPAEADDEGCTPLHHAARSTDPSVAALLLDAGASLDALNHAGQSPLAQAALAGNWRMLKFLAERGAKPWPLGGEPVLLAAAASDDDDPAGVEFLLRQKAAVDARGRQGRTALQQAAQAGHGQIVKTLLAAGADPLLADDEGLNAWLLAAAGGHQMVLEILLAAGADVNNTDPEGRDALIRAIENGKASPALATWLRESGIDTFRLDATGRGALDMAVAEGRWTLVAAIDPDYPLPASFAQGEGEVVRPPLQLLADALDAGDDETVGKVTGLLERQELDRALLEAVQRRPAQVGALCKLGANIEARNTDAQTALFLLLDAAADPAARQALDEQLKAGAQPTGRGGLARYLLAAQSARLEAAHGEPLALALLARGADAFAPAAERQTPLALAIRLGWMRLINALLAAGADPNRADARGMTALHLAAALGRDDAVQSLLAAGAQPALRAADGQTAQGIALSAGHRQLAEWLDWRGWPHPGRRLRASDLPAAAMQGDVAAIGRLLALGFAVDSQDAQGCTALLRAAGSGHVQAVAYLLAAGASPDIPASTGATALSAAVSRRHLAVVERLLAAGADFERPLSGGATVLMLASALGLPDIASRLIAAGARIDSGDGEGLLPIHCAALYGFAANDANRVRNLLNVLLSAGAAPDAGTHLGVTPLLFLLGCRAEPGAACNESVVLAGVEYLLGRGVNLAARDPRGFGALHLAALHGLPNVIRCLLRFGADPNMRDQLGRSPREIAMMRGLVDVAAEFGGSGNHGVSVASLLRERK